MMIVKATPSSEKGVMPKEEDFAKMGAYNEELAKAGVLVDLSGLQSSAHGMRIRFDGGKKTVVDGPFTESKELIAGYWIIDVKSPEEAREWALKAPNPSANPNEPGEIELRRFFEMEDFAPSPEIEKMKERRDKFFAPKS
ncbi:MAG TPA: YciI family protein [Caulobacteraceae bacterium]|jgi:hypothetical protein|nr:YciI family protein [Caulobacteraceae bacterium]